MSDVGLINSDSNCYSNVIVQAMYAIPKFRQVIFNVPSKSSKFLLEFKKLFEEMSKGSKPVRTQKFMSSCSWKPSGLGHQDSNEFFLPIITDLHKDKVSQFVEDLFEIRTVTAITSESFDEPRKSADTGWTLTLPIKGYSTFINSLTSQFQAEFLNIEPATTTRPKRDNRYNKGTTENPILVDAKMTKFVDILPPVLFIHLNKFEIDPESRQTIKIQTEFDLPMTLDLQPFLSSETTSIFDNSKSDFELSGIICHKGTSGCGHYVAYLKNGSQWTKYDDTKVTIVSENYIVQNMTKSGEISYESRDKKKTLVRYEETPYQLIYTSKCAVDLLKVPILMQDESGEEEQNDSSNDETNKTPPSSEISPISLTEMLNHVVKAKSDDIKALGMKRFLELVQDVACSELNLRPKMTFTPRNKVMPDLIFENDDQRQIHHARMVDQVSSSLSRLFLKAMEVSESAKEEIPKILPDVNLAADVGEIDEDIHRILIDPSTTWTHVETKVKYPGQCSKCHKMVPDLWVQSVKLGVHFCEDCHKGTLIPPQKETGKSGKPKPRRKNHFCRFSGCDKKYECTAGLTAHMRTHTGERPYKCSHPDCGKQFITAGVLRVHIRTHTTERPHKCPHPGCEKACRQFFALQVHMRTHTGERPYECPHPDCGKHFATQSGCSKHFKTHRN